MQRGKNSPIEYDFDVPTDIWHSYIPLFLAHVDNSCYQGGSSLQSDSVNLGLPCDEIFIIKNYVLCAMAVE